MRPVDLAEQPAGTCGRRLTGVASVRAGQIPGGARKQLPHCPAVGLAKHGADQAATSHKLRCSASDRPPPPRYGAARLLPSFSPLSLVGAGAAFLPAGVKQPWLVGSLPLKAAAPMDLIRTAALRTGFGTSSKTAYAHHQATWTDDERAHGKHNRHRVFALECLVNGREEGEEEGERRVGK